MKKLILFVMSLFVFNVFTAQPALVFAQEKKPKVTKAEAEKRRARAKKRREKRMKANNQKKHKSAASLKEAPKPEEPKGLSKRVLAWLEKMKKRVARSHAKHNQLVSVAAVRGDETDHAPPLYWKGKKSEGPVDLPELDAFDAAISDAVSGNRGKAIKSLEGFIQKHPKSSLVGDAKHTLNMLKEEQAAP